ncbi:hypothetical protein ACFY7C_21240 [Streptomyces sp. NPDC012769]|uniref:hypothetical protein n=1 Tax=Streptomyces sp. NPDC012769 TaxID=3364848 RepID=UPI0036A5920E
MSEQLVSVMPPGRDAGDVVEWGDVETLYGTRFPRDYMDFVARYGSGTIQETISVRLPMVEGPVRPYLAVTKLDPARLERMSHAAEGLGGHRLEDVLIWGDTVAADTLSWISAGDDPDDWPIAVYNSDDGWCVFECGMVEFLLKIIRAEFDVCPIGDLAVWGKAGVKFLHHREERRLYESGVDPWTGEVNPFHGNEFA